MPILGTISVCLFLSQKKTITFLISLKKKNCRMSHASMGQFETLTWKLGEDKFHPIAIYTGGDNQRSTEIHFECDPNGNLVYSKTKQHKINKLNFTLTLND